MTKSNKYYVNTTRFQSELEELLVYFDSTPRQILQNIVDKYAPIYCSEMKEYHQNLLSFSENNGETQENLQHTNPHNESEDSEIDITSMVFG